MFSTKLSSLLAETKLYKNTRGKNFISNFRPYKSLYTDKDKKERNPNDRLLVKKDMVIKRFWDSQTSSPQTVLLTGLLGKTGVVVVAVVVCMCVCVGGGVKPF